MASDSAPASPAENAHAEVNNENVESPPRTWPIAPDVLESIQSASRKKLAKSAALEAAAVAADAEAAKKAKTTKKPVVKAKTPKASAKTSKKASKPSEKVAAGHPSWKDMVKECIVANKEDVRTGVSRTIIKKYIEETYGLEMTPTNVSLLNRAIIHGAEHGVFALPKGPSGKVKLAPKARKASPVNENAPAEPRKSAEKKAPKAQKEKAAAPTKRASAKSDKAPIKKKIDTKPAAKPKKTSSARAEKKAPAAKASATKAKKAPASKAKAPASKSTSTKKPTSKVAKKPTSTKAATSGTRSSRRAPAVSTNKAR